MLDASGLEPLEAAEAGSSTLELAVETNSQLKAALRSVSMTMVAPPALAIDETAIEPEGSSYDAASRKIKWTVAPELRRNQPVTCRVGSAAAPETALSAGALRGVWNAAPVKMEFQSEGVTISGIEVEIQASITDTPPIAKLLRRFAAGDDQVAKTVVACKRSPRRHLLPTGSPREITKSRIQCPSRPHLPPAPSRAPSPPLSSPLPMLPSPPPPRAPLSRLRRPSSRAKMPEKVRSRRRSFEIARGALECPRRRSIECPRRRSFEIARRARQGPRVPATALHRVPATALHRVPGHQRRRARACLTS